MRRRGFTLIELLVVIAIIGVLATIILTELGVSRQKARDATRLSNLRTIGEVLEEYRVDHKHYPVSVSWSSDCGQPGNNWIPNNGDYGWSSGYISAMPRDPKQDCTASPVLSYEYKSDGDTYEVVADFETRAQPQGDSGVTYDGLIFTAFADSQGPLIATLSGPDSPTNESPIPFTISFSHAVVDFSAGSVFIINGFVTGVVVVSNAIYNFFVSPTDNALVTARLDPGAVHDAQGTGNDAAEYGVVYDPVRPHVALSPDPLPAGVSAPFAVSVNTTVPVTDFAASSVSASNATISGVAEIAPHNGSNYSFTVTPSAPGPVSLSVGDGVLHSSAGNPSVASNALSTTYAP